MLKKLLIVTLFLISLTNLFAVEGAWMRTDADASGFYMWFGGASKCPLTGKPLYHDIIYYPGSNSFETEIGPAFNFNQLDIVPMMGIWHNMTSGETEYLMPQLYFYYTNNNIYVESWNIYYHGSARTTTEQMFFYGRYFMKISGIVDWMSVGPQIEFTYDFDDELEDQLTSMPVGGRFSFPYGKGNSLEFFLGVDTQNDNQFTSRVSFIRYF